MSLPRKLSALALLSVASVLCAPSVQAQATQHYKQVNLTASTPGVAPVTDPNLVNAWGMSRSSGSPWWISDNTSGLSTLYTGTGSITPLVVTIPPGDPTSGKPGTPTGTVFNGGTGFQLKGKPATFLFVTEDGTIAAWNGGTVATTVFSSKGASVFKGATIATVNDPLTGPTEYLYVADLREGVIQIYDTNFNPVPDLASKFQDRDLPAGFVPFNIQNIGGNLFVTFAAQDSARHDELDGPGLGYVDAFSASGKLLVRFDHNNALNAPWGLTQASSDFGAFTHDILVGQFGNGEILAFNPLNGHFDGRLLDATGKAIKIDGLWALSFGSGGTSGSATALYFTAGPNNEQSGLFGMITPVENIQGNDQ